MNLIEQHRKDTPVLPLCEALGFPRATLYRRARKVSSGLPSRPGCPLGPALALSEPQRQEVLDLLHSERFRDLPPTQVYPMLLDEGRYLCSVRTMYRILAQRNEVRERRPVASHPVYAKPELLATAPNQVWSWDITKLKGPVTWTYFYLYVILDKLTLHADRGSSMKSKLLAELLADLGVIKSHSRPSVSNDNPFSESQFKTLKYRPEFPDRFGCLQDARAFCGPFFGWYNTDHHHCGIGFYTPADVHYGRVVLLKARRQAALDAAYERHPERFVRMRPQASCPPPAVWINPPKDKGLNVVEQPPRLLSNFQEVLSQSV
jgi:putative transposase